MIDDYSFGDKLLHRMALGSKLVRKMSFDFDDVFYAKNKQDPNNNHIFISGLARAGTTILMRSFYSTGEFRSLTYRDMPFVLMPNAWKFLSKSFQKRQEEKMRSHGDGIMVNFDSPEAFEEIFWLTFCKKDYLTDTNLIPHNANKETIEQFRLYISRIIASSNDNIQRRYLSKNNNNILRLGSIRSAFPEATIIIPFRDPVQHAISLFEQHKKFSGIHSEDKFALEYFGWLGHYEFGSSHLPFSFNNDFTSTKINYQPDNINYWLLLWANTYSYLSSQAPKDCFFVNFEKLCESPIEALSEIIKHGKLKLNEEKIIKELRLPVIKHNEDIDEEVRILTQKVFQNLLLK